MKIFQNMASSPTPSVDSTRGSNSIESFGDNNEYLSDSPLTLSGFSPPVSDSAICEEFSGSGATSISDSQRAVSSVASSASSTSSNSGLSSTKSSVLLGIKTNALENNVDSGIAITNNVISLKTTNGHPVQHCTACKSKQSDAVAKCFQCVNFLCSNCATAHEFMHCFNDHNVCLIDKPGNTRPSNFNANLLTNLTEFKFSSSLSMMLRAKPHLSYKKPDLFSEMIMNTNSCQNSLQSPEPNNEKGEMVANVSVNSSLLQNSAEMMPLLKANKIIPASQYFCSRHNNEQLMHFCKTCSILVCKDCVTTNHKFELHDIEHISEVVHSEPESITENIIAELRGKVGEIISVISVADTNINKIKQQYHKANHEINETFNFFCSMLEERKQELIKELETLYHAKIASNKTWMCKSSELIEKTTQSCNSIENALKLHSISDIITLQKNLDKQQQIWAQDLLLPFNILTLQKNLDKQQKIWAEDLLLPFDLEFVSNYQSIQVGVRNTFGYIRATTEEKPVVLKQPPIARPYSCSMVTSSSKNQQALSCLTLATDEKEIPLKSAINNNIVTHSSRSKSNSPINFDDKFSGKASAINAFGNLVDDGHLQINPYEKWSNGGCDNVFNGFSEQYTVALASSSCSSGNGKNFMGQEPLMSLTTKNFSGVIYPPKSQIKRQKMIYHCKFGEFGVMEGQFTEPSGVAVNAQNDIIVADTNNHRIQIFDKEGRFKFQFGECGKRDSQLLYPNRVAVVKTSGDIIVTERSPTHQIQIYNQYGQFVRKFGANILQHPRGVTVDNRGRIIVVECKVMRVIIFDQNGNVIQKFGCSKHLEFPNGVVVNEKQEIFISDNRAHCVKVFNYEGQYLRQIGGEGITNYPIGVGINGSGDILIADNHNNFNLTIFTQDGHLVSALESKVKHAQCFDVSLMDDGSVVLASKDYRLYIYRYIQIPPIGL